MKLQKGDIIQYHWIDAMGHAGWTDDGFATDERIPHIDEVGFFIKATKAGIWAAQGLSRPRLNDAGRDSVGMSFVPHGMIQSIKVLKRAK